MTELDNKYLDYPTKVLKGDIVAGELIKLACKRFMCYLQSDNIVFDSKKADKVVNFIEKLKLSTGKFANKNFKLSDWQKFVIYYVYGLVYKDSGLRVTREVYLQLSRKSGKTALASAMALYHLVADGENDGQIIFAANSTAQAQLAFTMATNYVSYIDPKGKYFKRYRDSIKFPLTKSIMKVVSADANRLDGLNISAAVIDEFHAAPNNAVSEVLSSSVGMRTQPLIIYVTTSGFDLTSPCYQMRNTCVELLHGKLKDDSLAAFIFELDEDDDIEDPKNWQKCQPNLGLTVTEDYIKSELVKAKNNPSLMTNFKTKILNKWVASAIGEWIPSEYLLKCSEKVNLEDYTHNVCYIGLDLSSVSDMTAISVLIFDNINQKYIFKNFYYLPQTALQESPNREKYRVWYEQKYLNLTSGNVVDYEYILNDIQKINKIIPIQAISYDSWQSVALIIKLTELGYNCVPFSQSTGSMNRPTRHLEMISRNNHLIIDDNPITRWMFANCELREDYNNNVKPIKLNKNSENKIDGVAAMCDALGHYLTETHYDNVIEGINFSK
ncbi:MAG: terminase large subunit [Lachnospiraceae bacterium]|nr:terminase large subunit [Lachnospiraceae bacterium]